MYAYNTSNHGMNNNPFVSDPTNAQARFPNIDANSPPQNAQFTSWLQPGVASNPTGYPQQQQMASYQQPQQQTPSYQYQQTGSGFAPGPATSPPPPFQPTSSFGQQLTAQINGSSYGYLNGAQQQQQQPTGYNPVQQQLQNNPGYVAQFDPYSSLGQWEGQGAGAQPPPQLQTSQSQSYLPPIQSPTQTSFGQAAMTSPGPNGQQHPREYIRSHKAELEAWDTYAWKQAIGAFEVLKDAWEARKKDIEGRATQLKNQLQYGQGGYYVDQIQQEGARLQGVCNSSQCTSLFAVNRVTVVTALQGGGLTFRLYRSIGISDARSIPRVSAVWRSC
ncbi:hypothetical protein HGRIS_003931 [Hohenbuehelia grisea]|uniref:Uncharacterized protein n=1 Tax=Hohenbuehelia grisea TaxID=104357 RepID=A0ABR3JHY7_9AGAR